MTGHHLDFVEHLKLDRRVKLRYGILLEPICLIREHDWTFVEGLGPFDKSGSLCRRCGRFTDSLTGAYADALRLPAPKTSSIYTRGGER